MKPIYMILSALLISSIFLLTEGCTLKELNNDAPTTIASNVNVVFDWGKTPDYHASSMVLYLYSEEHDLMNYWFNNPAGGPIKSYGGKHTAICHSNDDPYGHLLRNHNDHNEIEIFTDNTAMLVGQGISTRSIPRAPGTEDEPLRFTPSMIYGAQDKDINLKVTEQEQTLTFYPEELVCHYSVEFLEVENLKNSDIQIDATISSLAGGFYPGRMLPTSESVTHSFTLNPDVDTKSLSSNFLTFGLPSGEERPHMISLYIALRNRTGSFFTFDVSDQVNKATDPRNVHIKIYGLKLPEIPDDPIPPQDEGGVRIDIESWDTFHFDISV